MQASAPPDLGQIDPGVLMSAAGRNEFNMARQASGQAFSPAPQMTQTQFSERAAGCRCRYTPCTCQREARTMLEQNSWGPPVEGDVFSLEEAEEEVSFEDDEGDWTGLSSQAPQRHQARVASAARRIDDLDLAAMWMQGTGIPYDRGQLAAPGGDGFEFDTGEMNVDAVPRGGGGGGGSGARFRVDGGAPRAPAFNRELINNQGPMVEGARVRGFAVLRETGPGATRPRPERPQAERPAPTPRPMAVVMNGRQIRT